MSADRRLATFRGRKIDDMTREELIDALTLAANTIRDQFESHQREFETLRKMREARS